MITRRDALKLGVAGLAIPAAQLHVSAGANARQMDQTTEWTSLAGNPARTRVMPGPGPRFDQTISLTWQVANNKSGGWTFPIVHQGKVIYSTGDSIGLVALDLGTGTEVWTNPVSVTSHIADNGTIFCNLYDDGIVAVDSSTGATLWTADITQNVRHAMVASGGILYCRSSTEGLVAFDVDSGQRLWNVADNTYDESPIAIGNGAAYFTSAVGILFSVDATTGEENWRADFPALSENPSTSIIVGDSVLYMSDDQGNLHAYSADSGTEIWVSTVDPSFVLMAYLNDRLFGESTSLGVCAFDATNGERIWNVAHEMDVHISGVTSDTVLAFTQADWDTDGWPAFGLDPLTGEQLWSFPKSTRTYDLLLIGSYLLIPGLLTVVGQNPTMPVLIQDVSILGGPASGAVVRGTAAAGSEVQLMGNSYTEGATEWVEVTIDGVLGWIPLDALDPTSVPTGNTEPTRTLYEPN